jgi:hypothetical protein
MRLVRRSLLAGLTLLALLVVAGWTSVPQEGGGIAVVGQVTNGTPGAGFPAGLTVALHVFSGVEETAVYTTTAAADGSYRFEGLALDAGQTVVARVVYQGSAYLSDLVTFEPGQRELSRPVVIYESTEYPVSVQVTQLHIFLTPVGDRLHVAEYYLAGNDGGRTYVGTEDPETGRRTTLDFTLPAGAEELSFDGPGLGERFLARENGFVDTYPVPPGTVTSEIFFRYTLPYQVELRIERAFDVPVASIVLVVPEGDGVLRGEGITSTGEFDTEAGSALSYAAGPLAAGESLAFDLIAGAEPVPAAEAGGLATRNSAVETGIGVVALALAVVATYLMWRKPSPGPVPERARPLVEAIAALDARFEAGQLDEDRYHEERDALKRQVYALVEGGGGAGERRSRGVGTSGIETSRGEEI